MALPSVQDGHVELQVKRSRPKVKLPRKYRVILFNDDFTPMDFVVEILVEFFSMTDQQATSVMWQVHKFGKGVCGIFTRDVAETKTAQVNEYARSQNYPLMCDMEPV